MAEVKVTYFGGIRGRAEIIRLVMAAAKAKFEDKTIEFKDWPEMKPTTPFGSLPVANIDGKDYGQAIALATYFARVNKLYPEDPKQALLTDIIALSREDMLIAESAIAFAKDEKETAEKIKTLDALYDQVLPTIENYLKLNMADNKFEFACGKTLTLADIIILEGTQGLSQKMPQTVEKYPTIKAVREKAAASPGIKDYLAKRKETDL